MHDAVYQSLEAYFPRAWDDLERAHVLKTMDFVRRTPLAFTRDQEALGHVGGSAVVVNASRTHILLAKHTVLEEWFFFGNHCEGDGLPLVDVAMQRVVKDAGEALAATAVSDGKILDVDVHYVPAHERKGEAVPHHLHYDIAFLFVAEQTTALNPQARWFTIEEALAQHMKRGVADTQFVRTLYKVMGHGRA